MEKIKIGIETHVQLNTKTKLFCGCSMKDINSVSENSRCCPTCLGMPGSKPRVNKGAIDAAIKVALALNCDVLSEMYFSRKTYFYPDMSKNFQITQYEVPLAKDGKLEIIDFEGKVKKIGIERIHLEEDPAKLQHVGGDISTANYTLIDYNRSGIPLIEIVTKPEFSHPKEVRRFLKKLVMILEYLDVYVPGDLSLKSDLNISIDGRERVEIKNVTGAIDAEKALQLEIVRQKGAIMRGEKIERETRAWLPGKNITISLRKKETENDYGYIFEPDLTKIEISKKWILEMKNKIPELPHHKFERYQKEFDISPELINSIIDDFYLAEFYEKCVKKEDPKLVATWVNILKKILYYNKKSFKEAEITSDIFLKLLKMIKRGEITDLGAEMILREITFNQQEFDKISKKYVKTDDIASIIDGVIKENKEAVFDYKSGNEKVMQFLIGQVIRKSNRTVDAKTAKRLLEEKL
ncbi:MAG: Asp-tRNA(Asn)/Glu-tRNA(Gln) amidotransferase subunit GatB [Nanoarchaeota archaeon]|nr:Asp-tRNA(Asn)/Glu-tRNA(Gln) amidotransferase subunit GatB [Nanoarchaeota archaeon]